MGTIVPVITGPGCRLTKDFSRGQVPFSGVSMIMERGASGSMEEESVFFAESLFTYNAKALMDAAVSSPPPKI